MFQRNCFNFVALLLLQLLHQDLEICFFDLELLNSLDLYIKCQIFKHCPKPDSKGFDYLNAWFALNCVWFVCVFNVATLILFLLVTMHKIHLQLQTTSHTSLWHVTSFYILNPSSFDQNSFFIDSFDLKRCI